jgi:hypothetical protein
MLPSKMGALEDLPMKIVAVPLLALALAAPAARAGSYKEFCDQFEPLRKLTGLKYIKPQVKVDPKTAGVKAQDVVFTIDAKTGPIKLTPDAQGLVEFPMTDALCDENPDIQTNQPKGTVNLGISIDPAIPPVRTLDYRLLDSLRREWDVAIARQSLMWRMMAPTSKAYQILFEPGRGASAEIQLAGGARKLVADDKGELRIPFDDSWIAANPTIVLSELPKKIGLAFK